MKGLFVIALVVWIIAAIWRSKTRREQVNRSWDAVRSAHGLQMTRASAFAEPTLRGELGGYRVAVDTVTHGNGKSRTTYTRYRVHYPKIGTELHLTREIPLVSTLGKMFGGQDHEIGDAAFDAKVVVRGPSESKAREYLTASRRRAIERFLSAHKRAVITESNASFETVGLETRSEGVEHGLRRLLDLARELAPAGVAVEHLTRPPSMTAAATGVAAALGATLIKHNVPRPNAWDDVRDEFAPEGHLQDAREPVVDDPPPPAEPPQSAEPAAVNDLPGEPSEQPLVVGSVPEMPELPSIDPDASDAPHAPPPGSARQHDVCATLFAEGSGLTSARDIFETDYADMFVHWTGELKSARHYYSDMVFGNDPGTRAEVSVARVPSAYLGEREIVAVVQLPEGVDKQLAPRVGTAVTFEGDLASMDAFMRQVFVRNATVID